MTKDGYVKWRIGDLFKPIECCSFSVTPDTQPTSHEDPML